MKRVNAEPILIRKDQYIGVWVAGCAPWLCDWFDFYLTQPEALAAALAHIRTHHQPEETK